MKRVPPSLASRSRFFTRQLRVGILLAIALQIVLVFGGATLYLRHAYNSTMDLVDAERNLISENLFQIYQRTLEGAVILAESGAARLAPLSGRFLNPGPFEQRIFEQNVRRLDFVHSMQFVAADGTVLIDSRGPEFAGVSLHGREQFERTVALSLGGMYIGAPVYMDEHAVFVVGTPVYSLEQPRSDPPIGVILNYIDPGVEYLALEGLEHARYFRAYLLDDLERTLFYWPQPSEKHGQRYAPRRESEGAVVRSTPPVITLHIVQDGEPAFLDVLRAEGAALGFFALLAGGALIVQLLLLRVLTALSGAHAKALGAKDALLRELHHRVKNNLQVLISLLGIEQSRLHTAQDSGGEHGHELHELEHTMEKMQARMAAMAEVHDAIYQSERLDTVNIHAVLNALAARVLSTRREHLKVQVHAESEQAAGVPIETAVPLGLLVNELLSNAARHAFPADSMVAEPRIDIALRREAQQLIICVADNGCGFDPRQVERGLGLVLVEELAGQINADTCHERPEAGGSRWEISVPLSEMS